MLVAGVDSSTQSCKVVIRDADTGRLVRQGRARHPEGTEVHPDAWWQALTTALAEAGGLDGVGAVSIGGQQHGMVCLDSDGQVVRPALLWNDTRSAGAALDLVAELGARYWAEAVGSVPLASFTVTKLRWLAEHEPDNAARTAAVCLPHDWLGWRLAGTGLDALVTDRSDASGTGYFDGRANAYRTDLLSRALGHQAALPRVAGPAEVAAEFAGPTGPVLLGPGAGDNAAGMLGVQAGGDVLVSLGTSGVACARSGIQPADGSGLVAGFSDATGEFLPLVCTLNAARVLDAAARLLGVGLAELSTLALSAEPGAGGVTVVPYLEGERTPNLPDATGAVHGLTLANAQPANLARAAVEGMLCGLADGLDALVAQGVAVSGVRLIGGAAQSEAVRRIAPTVFGVPVTVPQPGEYVADGAARQAAWVLAGTPEPPVWDAGPAAVFEAAPTAGLRERYAEAAARYLNR
ncbi:MAG: xylulokinase [Pseudonocardiales bacterium]|jgi:xylulokinase|nr:xylulokinase [Pseudonocardiales bacterium]